MSPVILCLAVWFVSAVPVFILLLVSLRGQEQKAADDRAQIMALRKVSADKASSKPQTQPRRA